MPHKELQNIKYSLAEVTPLPSQLRDLQTRQDITTDQVKGSMTEPPYTLHNVTVSGCIDQDKNIAVANLIALIDNRLKRIDAERLKIELWIDTIPESRIRMALSLKYVNGLTWEQVVAHVNPYESAHGLKQACLRYIEQSPPK